MAEQPPPNGTRAGAVERLISAIKGLTITNVLIIALLLFIMAPAYVLYRVVNDDELLDRFLSSYTDTPHRETGCAVRTARVRGGSKFYGISAGFAFQGTDRYYVSVQLSHDPSEEEITSYCQVLYLMIDKLNAGGRDNGP